MRSVEVAALPQFALLSHRDQPSPSIRRSSTIAFGKFDFETIQKSATLEEYVADTINWAVLRSLIASLTYRRQTLLLKRFPP